jgi:hypothetical protein
MFAVVKLGDFTNMRYRGLVKSAKPAFTALALANVYRSRGHPTGEMRPYWANCGAKVLNRPERAMKNRLNAGFRRSGLP